MAQGTEHFHTGMTAEFGSLESTQNLGRHGGLSVISMRGRQKWGIPKASWARLAESGKLKVQL